MCLYKSSYLSYSVLDELPPPSQARTFLWWALKGFGTLAGSERPSAQGVRVRWRYGPGEAIRAVAGVPPTYRSNTRRDGPGEIGLATGGGG